MGLNIKVYHNIIETSNHDDADFVADVLNNSWDWKIKNLKRYASYIGDCVDRGTISYPYSYHSRFREALVSLIGRNDLLGIEGQIKWSEIDTPENANIPFHAFIVFADNEGCIDWECSESLFADFDKHMQDAETKLSPTHLETYKKWHHVFDLGRKKGVVVFC